VLLVAFLFLEDVPVQVEVLHDVAHRT
jgi:hypothetical protein